MDLKCPECKTDLDEDELQELFEWNTLNIVDEKVTMNCDCGASLDVIIKSKDTIYKIVEWRK